MTRTTPTQNSDRAATEIAADMRRREHLDHALVRGIAWIGGMRGVTAVVQWVSTIIVIRLLRPEDYGLVAMATAYIGFAKLVTEFGLSTLIVQRRGLTEHQIAQLGTVSIMFGSLLFGVSVVIAPVIASFFREPAVRGIVIMLGITFPLGAVAAFPSSLLMRDLEFSTLALLNGVERISQAVITASLAIAGYGYWSIVLGAVVAKVIRAGTAWAKRPHRLAFPSNLDTIKDELWFGWHVVVTRVTLYVRRFSEVAIVGRLFGTAILGAYNVAWTLARAPLDRGIAVINSVTPSIFAGAQDDAAALRRYLRILTEGASLFAFPAAVGLAVVADDFVLLVFGERWMGAIGPLRILALAAAFNAITPFLSQVLIATNQPKRNMQFAVASAVVMPILFYAGSFWGVLGVALAWLVGQPLITATVLARQALRQIGMSWTEYGDSLKPAALGSVATAAGVLAIRAVLPGEWSLTLRFVIQATAGIAIYGVGVFPTYRARIRSLKSLMNTRPAS